MAYDSLKTTVSARLAEIRAAGLYKSERQILGPQGAEIRVAQGDVLNLCANNYL
jgi:glycine C-acetyltransferase